MDELEISGRRYITSKRAAKEHKYHPDYIGQLIRGGKIVGQKVGRVWYVDAEALSAYFSGEEFVETKETSEETVPEVINPTPRTEEDLPVFEEKIAVEELPEESQPIHIRLEKDDEVETATVTGLRYVADDNALFPGVAAKKPVYKDIIHEPLVSSSRTSQEIFQKKNNKYTFKYFVTMFVASTVVLVISLALSALLTETLIVDEKGATQTAIVFDASTLLH